MPSRGRFISIEGIEGVGKSTQCALLCAAVKARGRGAVLTREPGGTELGEMLRAVLLDSRIPAMNANSELLLMFAARAEHIARVVAPALERGDWVISDRFTDATYAYQGGGRGIDVARIETLEDLVQQGLRPDRTIVLDMPVEAALARAHGRSEPDRFERELSEFFQRVRDSYLSRAAADPERCRVVAADQSIDTVANTVLESVAGWLQ
jgi:dTMP kinase